MEVGREITTGNNMKYIERREMKKISIPLTALLFLGACTHTIQHNKLAKLSIGMDKNTVRKKLGEPVSIRCTSTNGTETEAWEYDARTAPTFFEAFFRGEGARRDTFVVYFVNGSLTQWGKPNDWQKESTHIQEIRYR